jgi:hypothetical protein
MAQIIQYKDRLLDTSVYPVTVAAAVYLKVGNDSSLNTLDNTLKTKVESISLFQNDDSTENIINEYQFVPVTDNYSALDASQISHVRELLNIESDLNEIKTDISDTTSRLEQKQDVLYHGENENGNIKTINGWNILGNGNLEIFSDGNVTIAIEQQMDSDSSNAISSKAIYEYITPIFNDINKDLRAIQDYLTIEYLP